MALPRPDEPAYTGDIVVKTQTYAKSKTTKASGLDRVRKAIASLDAEAASRLTIDRLDPKSDISVENQLIINKELCSILRKEALKLQTFLKNN